VRELVKTFVSRQQYCPGKSIDNHVLTALTLISVLFLHACATPVSSLRSMAAENQFVETEVRAGGYALTVFKNNVAYEDDAESNVLHVYLEGDGSPWMFRTIVMADPTPRRPLMLSLMSIDTAPSVYLGRPCYNGHADDEGCNSDLWTFGRYSVTVVNSMASAIRALAKRQNASEVWLFGHSGGGALAMLLAADLNEVSRIITIAGNLDTDAWTSHHRFTPLFSSLNPARQPPLRESVSQWHFVGSADGVIPPEIVRQVIMRQAQAEAYSLNGFTHGCCWESVWPKILQGLALKPPAAMPGNQFKSRARITDALGSL